jgi:hypothetical protein
MYEIQPIFKIWLILKILPIFKIRLQNKYKQYYNYNKLN